MSFVSIMLTLIIRKLIIKLFRYKRVLPKEECNNDYINIKNG